MMMQTPVVETRMNGHPVKYNGELDILERNLVMKVYIDYGEHTAQMREHTLTVPVEWGASDEELVALVDSTVRMFVDRYRFVKWLMKSRWTWTHPMRSDLGQVIE